MMGVIMTASGPSFENQKNIILAEVQPSPQKTDLELLLTHIVLYLNRVVHSGTLMESRIPDHELFSYRRHPLSTELAFELDYRLQRLANYHLRNPDRISEILMHGLKTQVPMKLNRLQVQYLQQLVKHPLIGTMALAKKLETSSRKINRVRRRLFSQYGIHIAAVLNPHKFGLVHFGVGYHGTSSKATQHLNQWLQYELKSGQTLPFLTGANIDVNGLQGFFSLYVPNQVQSLEQFHRTLAWLKKHFLEDFKLHRIQGFFTHMNFDFYDYVTQQWNLTPDLHTEAALRFIDEHGSQFSPLRGFTYHGAVFPFQQPDWLLAITSSEGLMNRSEQQELLRYYGFSLAKKTIWTHLQQLQHHDAYYSYVTISRLAFPDIICLLITCDQEALEILHQLFVQYPSTYLFPTDAGAIILLGIPSGGSSLIKQLTRTLLTIPKIKHTSVLRFNRHLPLLPSLERHTLWNIKTVLWEASSPVYPEE
jgi:hypothetical protein